MSAPYELLDTRALKTLSPGTRWARFRPGTSWTHVLSEPALFHTMLFSGEASSRRSFYLWQYSPITSFFSSNFFSRSFCPCQFLFVAIPICSNIDPVAAFTCAVFTCAAFICTASFIVVSVRGNIHSAVVLPCRSWLVLAVLLYPTATLVEVPTEYLCWPDLYPAPQDERTY